ncbi:peptidylprolyl isomerase [Candidatus Riflebacteria bacterium]
MVKGYFSPFKKIIKWILFGFFLFFLEGPILNAKTLVQMNSKEFKSLAKIFAYEDARYFNAEFFKAQMTSNNYHLQLFAIRALGRIGYSGGLGLLKTMLEENISSALKREILWGIGQIPGPESFNFLLKQVKKQKQVDLKKMALNGLFQVATKDNFSRVKSLLDELEDKPALLASCLKRLYIFGDPAIQSLQKYYKLPAFTLACFHSFYKLKKCPGGFHPAEFLGNANKNIARYSLYLAGFSKNPLFRPLILQALDFDGFTRIIVALKALREFPHPENLEKLFQLKNHPNPNIRAETLLTLAPIQFAKRGVILEEFLTDPSRVVRKIALKNIAINYYERFLEIFIRRDKFPELTMTDFIFAGTQCKKLDLFQQTALEQNTPFAVKFEFLQGKSELLQDDKNQGGKIDNEFWLHWLNYAAKGGGEYLFPILAASALKKSSPGLLCSKLRKIISKLENKESPLFKGLLEVYLQAGKENSQSYSFLLPLEQYRDPWTRQQLYKKLNNSKIKNPFLTFIPVHKPSYYEEICRDLLQKPDESISLKLKQGEYQLKLLKMVAPMTCYHFKKIALKQNFKNITIHRHINDFVLQGGDPTGTGWGFAGENIRSERSSLDFDAGMVGIAHSGKDTGGSQFFITLSNQWHLSGKYTIFARVVKRAKNWDFIQTGDRILAFALLP